jgi:dTDP-4-amino-4,6-dideoxygalactose transaminase
MINVTKTFLPPKKEYQIIIDQAWDEHWLTNRGVLVKQLENNIEQYLKSPSLIAMTNGTIPLLIGLNALECTGDIITTPFSYIASTSSILWQGCNPIFVDVDSEYWTIDESKIESAITPKTTAILATHVFGNPCNVNAIQNIANKYDLKVIYDGSHCFGVNYLGESLFNYGDISTCSFHATKIFHTGEGGALFCSNEAILKKAFLMHNFGHDGPGKFSEVGINGKMSEIQAGMGLAVLPYLNNIILERKRIANRYYRKLRGVPLQFMKLRPNTSWNYSYFPILFENEITLEKTMKELNRNEINTRRYFFPSLNKIPQVNSTDMPVSEDLSLRILCLPIYPDLALTDVDRICKIISDIIKNESK